MVIDSPRARTERALAELVTADGTRAVTVARVDQSVAADVVRQWRGTQRVGAATEDETRAFEALRAIIRQAVLTERAKQDDAVNQAASAATEEAEEARGKLFVYEQQATAQAAQATDSPAPAPTEDKEQSAATTTTNGKKKA